MDLGIIEIIYFGLAAGCSVELSTFPLAAVSLSLVDILYLHHVEVTHFQHLLLDVLQLKFRLRRMSIVDHVLKHPFSEQIVEFHLSTEIRC